MTKKNVTTEKKRHEMLSLYCKHRMLTFFSFKKHTETTLTIFQWKYINEQNGSRGKKRDFQKNQKKITTITSKQTYTGTHFFRIEAKRNVCMYLLWATPSIYAITAYPELCVCVLICMRCEWSEWMKKDKKKTQRAQNKREGERRIATGAEKNVWLKTVTPYNWISIISIEFLIMIFDCLLVYHICRNAYEIWYWGWWKILLHSRV